MKRIISLILVLCLLISVCGCKREDPEDTAAPLDITEGAPEKEDLPEDETEQEQNTQAESEQPKEDKAEPCNLTLENTFSQYEVIVTLTKDETAKGKEYTAKDFADYNVFYVLENDAYYGNPNFKDSYPEYQDKTTLFMYLNEPSKENVLKTVKELEADERVFAACPNPVPASNELVLYFTEEYNKELMTLAAEYEKVKTENNFATKKEAHDKFALNFEKKIREDFCYDELYFFNVWADNAVEFVPEIKVKISVTQENSFTIYDALKRYLQDTRITKIAPINSTEKYIGSITFTIIDPGYNESKPYTAEDFKKYTDMKMTHIGQVKSMLTNEVGVSLQFETPAYQYITDTITKLNSDSKIINARPILLQEPGYVDTDRIIY